MPAVDPKVYGAILSVRPARRFDIACLLMRMYGYIMNIGTVAMLSALASIAIGFLFGTLRLAIPHYEQVLIVATCIDRLWIDGADR